MNPIVRFKSIHPLAKLPKRNNPTDTGMDLYAAEGGMIYPGGRNLVSTGLLIALPAGYEGQVRPRSGLAAKNGVTVLNAPGSVDDTFRGELKVILHNSGNTTFFFELGDRIAQLVIAPVTLADAVLVDELDETDRGTNGFGSSGVK